MSEKIATNKTNFGLPVAIILAGSIIGGAIYFSNISSRDVGISLDQVAETQKDEMRDQQALGEKIIPVSADGNPTKGNEAAPVNIIEFSDYQCPYCKSFVEDTLGKILTEYVDTGKVKYIFRDFPLDFHIHAQKAAEAAHCAGEQNKYWEYHDLLFAQQEDWEAVPDALGKFKKYAGELNLNQADFGTCLDTGRYAEEVQKDYADGVAAGVTGTPGFFINGRLLTGAQDYSVFKQIIESELNK